MAVDNKFYDEHANTWWEEVGPLTTLRFVINPVRFGYFKRVLDEELHVRAEGKKMLDVGSGGGYLAEEFARLGYDVTGIDPSAPSLEAARRHAAQEGLAIEYSEGKGEDLPFEDGAFEIVCCCDVLEHVDDLERVVGEIERVLAAGGTFFYDTVNRTLASKFVMIKLMQEWKWTSFMPPGLHDWDMFIKPQELDALLQKNGLEPQEIAGMVPRLNPLQMVLTMRALKKGKIDYEEFSSRVKFKEGEDTSISYMGHALKPERA